MAETLVIETEDLRKNYDGVEAVRGVTLQVPAGSIFAFLGRNGAGKTSTIKMLLGMSRPTSGHARVFDLAVDSAGSSVAIRRRTGFVSEEKDLYDPMTVEQIIRFTASFYPGWRRDLEQRYLRSFDLPVGRKVKDSSRGARTKLALLLAFSRGAELLVLDEPTSGLDPAATEDVLQALVTHVASEELTVFLSSHHLADVDQIADRIAIIERGQVIVAGALEDLREVVPPGPVGLRRGCARGRLPLVRCRAHPAPGSCPDAALQLRGGAHPRRGSCPERRVRGGHARHAQRDLSRIGSQGELTCSGTSSGSTRAGDF